MPQHLTIYNKHVFYQLIITHLHFSMVKFHLCLKENGLEII